MENIILQVGQWAAKGVPQFLGFILGLAVILYYVEKFYHDTLGFLQSVFGKKPKNNFFISEKNVDKKFIEELRKFYGDKERKSE